MFEIVSALPVMQSKIGTTRAAEPGSHPVRTFILRILTVGLVGACLVLVGVAQTAGYALEFDGTSGYVRIDNTATVMQGNAWADAKVLSVWLEPANSVGPSARPERGALIVGNDRPRSFGISRALWDGLDGIWAFNADSDGVDFVGVAATPGEWTQITMVHANGALVLYRNGVQVGSTPSGPTETLGGSAVGTLYLGGSDSNRTPHFSGWMDEVRLWNVGQDAQTVLDWVDQPVNAGHPQWASLTAYYQMVEGFGTVLSDQSSYDHPGTLLGGMGNQSWVPSGAFGSGGNAIPTADDQTALTDEDTAVGIQLTGSDGDGDTLSYFIVNGPASGQIDGLPPDVIYTPDANFNGTDSFTFKVNDGTADSAPALVTIQVAPINDPPFAGNDSAVTMESQAVTIEVLVNDVDVDGDALSVLDVGAAAGGTVENLVTAVRYTPGPGFTGADAFTYTVSDGHGGVAGADVSVTVTTPNAAPVADDQSLSTPEDTPLGITLSGSDVDGDPLTYVLVSSPSSGQLSGDAPHLVYTPASNFNGNDSFSFLVNDGLADSPPALVAITVNPVNDPPTATDDTAAATQDVSLTIDVLQNDSDVDGDALTVSAVGSATLGTVENLGNSIRYTPLAGALGQDAFDYDISDGNGGTATAQVTVSITAASSLAGYALDFDGNSDFVGLAETAVMMGPGWEDNKTISLWVLPQGPSEACSSPALCSAVFGDRPRWWGISRGVVSGQDKLWIWNYDGSLDVIAVDYIVGQWMHLSMVHANGHLLAYADGVEVGDVPSGTTLQPNTGANPILQIGGVISSGNFTFQGQIDEVSIWNRGLTGQEVAGGVHGILAGTENGLVAYYRMSDGAGVQLSDDSGHGWTGTLEDGGPNVPGDGQPAQWVVSTVPLTNPPTADDLSVVTAEDTPLSITLTGSDPAGQPLVYEVVANPMSGQLTGAAPDLLYTPAANFNGVDSFSFKVNNGETDSTPGIVTIDVAPVNDAPTAVNDTAITSAGIAVIIDVLANDTDPDGDTLAVWDIGAAAAGTVENLGNSVRYTPDPGFSGGDGFGYTVADGQGGFSVATVAVTVGAVNDPPTAQNGTFVTDEDTPVGITLVGSDPNGDPLTFALVSGPSFGSLSGQAPDLVYTPAADFNGTDGFSFRVNDGLADSADGLVTIQVAPVNDDPVALDDSGVTPIETPVTLNVLANDSDVDGDTLSVSAVGTAADGTVENLGDSVRYTPANGFVGTDVFSYTISDGNGGTTGATVQVTVANQLILQETGWLDTPGSAWNVTLDQSLAYVADFGGGLRIVDVSDTTNPVEIGSLVPASRTYSVRVVDNLAYLANGRDGVGIVDVSDPSAPAEVGTLDTPDLAWRVAVALPYVYVADRSGGLRVIDAGEPANPVEVGFAGTTGQFLDVLVQGDLAYVADFNGWVRVFDVSDPSQPTEIEAISVAGSPYGLAVDGDYLYVAAGQRGLDILDISLPASPVEVGSETTSGLARNVAVMGGFAFVTNDGDGLEIIDVFDPVQPFWTAHVDTPGRVRDVAAANGYVYIADHEGGLRIVRIF